MEQKKIRYLTEQKDHTLLISLASQQKSIQKKTWKLIFPFSFIKAYINTKNLKRKEVYKYLYYTYKRHFLSVYLCSMGKTRHHIFFFFSFFIFRFFFYVGKNNLLKAYIGKLFHLRVVDSLEECGVFHVSFFNFNPKKVKS